MNTINQLTIEPPASILRAGNAETTARDKFLEALALDGFDENGNRVGRPRNARKAAALYREAAMLGYPLAMFNYGVACLKGEGMPKLGRMINRKSYQIEAVGWFRKAAAAGLGAAHNNLGYCYERGLGGLEVDPNKAEMHYELARNLGDPKGKLNLTKLRDDLRPIRSQRLLAVQGNASKTASLVAG